MAILNFDATTVEPSTSKDPVPAGKYLAVISASEMKPTRNGAGQYLECEYQIIDGPFKGRKLWSRHNLQNPNPQAVQVARRELSSICHAVGVMQTKDSGELHHLPLTIMVKTKQREDNGETVSEVVGWARKDALAGVPQQVSATVGPDSKPWLRR